MGLDLTRCETPEMQLIYEQMKHVLMKWNCAQIGIGAGRYLESQCHAESSLLPKLVREISALHL
jgi:hypothetical protein